MKSGAAERTRTTDGQPPKERTSSAPAFAAASSAGVPAAQGGKITAIPWLGLGHKVSPVVHTRQKTTNNIGWVKPAKYLPLFCMAFC